MLHDRLLEVRREGDRGREDPRAVGVAEEPLVRLVDREPGVDHRHQEAEEAERGVRARRYPVDRLADVGDPLGAEVLRLEGDDQGVGRDQGGPRAEVEVGGAVDQDQVITAGDVG